MIYFHDFESLSLSPAPSIDIECRVLERRVTRDLRASSVTNFAANTIRLLLKRKRFKRFRLEYRWLESGRRLNDE